jgi:hypothetical protein
MVRCHAAGGLDSGRFAGVLRPVPLFAALLVLVVSGLVHGLWTHRWGSAEELERASARVPTVPLSAGPWTGVNVEVDSQQFKQTRADSYWMRRYARPGESEVITVILMCGRPGSMGVHTPDICYRGAGFEMSDEPTRQVVALPGGAGAEFWSAHFRQPGKLPGTSLHLYWSWGYDGRWQAPASPRWEFGGAPYLYKLYVVCETAADGRTSAFLQELLPSLQQALFCPEGPGR